VTLFIFLQKKDSNGCAARQKLGLASSPLKMVEVQCSFSCKTSFALVSLFGSLTLWPPAVKWKVKFAGSMRQADVKNPIS